jgi:acylphosphatase
MHRDMNDTSSDERLRARLLIVGYVQGVGYRAFTRHAASRRGLVGGVKNLDDGRVEADVEGIKSVIEAMIRELKIGPPGARVQQVQVEWAPASGRFADFQIWY